MTLGLRPDTVRDGASVVEQSAHFNAVAASNPANAVSMAICGWGSMKPAVKIIDSIQNADSTSEQI